MSVIRRAKVQNNLVQERLLVLELKFRSQREMVAVRKRTMRNPGFRMIVCTAARKIRCPFIVLAPTTCKLVALRFKHRSRGRRSASRNATSSSIGRAFRLFALFNSKPVTCILCLPGRKLSAALRFAGPIRCCRQSKSHAASASARFYGTEVEVMKPLSHAHVTIAQKYPARQRPLPNTSGGRVIWMRRRETSPTRRCSRGCSPSALRRKQCPA